MAALVAGLGTAGPSRQSEPAPCRQGPVTPAGPGRPRCFPRAQEGRTAPAKPAPRTGCPRPGKISGRPGASAARGRLREPAKPRKLTSRDRDKRRPRRHQPPARKPVKPREEARTRPPPGTDQAARRSSPAAARLVLPERLAVTADQTGGNGTPGDEQPCRRETNPSLARQPGDKNPGKDLTGRAAHSHRDKQSGPAAAGRGPVGMTAVPRRRSISVRSLPPLGWSGRWQSAPDCLRRHMLGHTAGVHGRSRRSLKERRSRPCRLLMCA